MEIVFSETTQSVSNWKYEIAEANEGCQEGIVTNVNDPSLRYVFKLGIVRGIAYPPWMNEDRWSRIDNLVTYRSSDILVATYPKCGTTWVEQTVLLLLNGGQASQLNPAAKNSYTGEGRPGKIWIEAQMCQEGVNHPNIGKNEFTNLSKDGFDNAPSRRVIKTHAPVDLIIGTKGLGFEGLPNGTKVIAVVRNPLDACVSSYYHAFNPFKSGWPFDAWAAAWLYGITPHGKWSHWLKGWYSKSQQYPQQILLIFYEDLKNNAFEVTRRLAEFLGINYDENLIHRTIEGASFESMKNHASRSGGDNHLRKGITGDWRNHFGPQLAQEFIDDFYKECKGMDIQFSLGFEGENPLIIQAPPS